MKAAPNDSHPAEVSSKREETRLFVFLIVFLFPILSVLLVSSYGFAVWILQMIFGPPGPS
ncbi:MULTISPECIES: periplasmic nitrate reductase, NapE protein [Stutzerimonas stutzeri subgroup]|jgi:nitrate reductase NapE|uniref:Periplasmic nitrate reductase NapE subunit n=1 Tax=Stutzerimonas stutzeri NF13 TaxID=1212548 RepID=M2VGM2_STUST|nr:MULTISPECIES: periplasmic nitrate reductase, NapE protein [Stutzerimonas stutzeri subgroup]MBS69835.1 periplasmic nitrate reductase, NapE protein [Pseudomonas sp.]WOF80229.1 periplasmic nitrate reductase, NapE protein [Pseudomonas sp. FeN3W]EMD99132.1 periplasmic nitrate reductase NapE subunit [Stutzerimonas stutzeri NF13]MBK3880445.1 periplasmic nitrate reductase, NapE protein [Stutzerimonas stutzeri]MCQ4292326.1 periplasmic nitrate reductase, NapE protein [Stutzerimonas stutzeri]|tara:strand:- start:2768 stop:2947 length:180 start_codon:yes stop_codon:yes gene_type:complete